MFTKCEVKNLELIHNEKSSDGFVECLGMRFPNDDARREYFLGILREKLKDPEFRKIEGFPIGEDEDILALSDPPYYTACPNPFIEDFIKFYGKPYNPDEPYHREPLASDVSEGKNDPIYNAHSYHTKIPHKAIMRYILHYTEPGDIVFDGFCGTGMTGVAAQLCGDKSVVESLGYKVKPDGTILDEKGKPFSKLGARKAVLNDLSPAATFIAYNYNTPVDIQEFEWEAKRILKEVEDECGWMYITIHNPKDVYKALKILEGKESNLQNLKGHLSENGISTGQINYTVWSDVFVCPECVQEIVYWDVAVDKEKGKVSDEFSCPNCSANLNKRIMERAWVTKFDKAINQTIKQAKQVPVLINYTSVGKRYEKKPDEFDLALIEKIENSDIPYWFPTNRMPEGYNTEQPKISHGFTYVHHFYTKRNLWVLGCFYKLIIKTYYRLKISYIYILTAIRIFLSKQSKIQPEKFFLKKGQSISYVTGTLYMPSFSVENCPLVSIKNRIRTFYKMYLSNKLNKLSFLSNDSLKPILNPNKIDYIFTDPPFGGNLMYSELNFLWESWLKVFTNNKTEAIENKVQGKGMAEYQEIMTKCFQEYYRVLKPGRWMTVIFHNSKNSVWNAIQEALQRAGFVIADIRTLDKKQGSFKQVTSSAAVKQDIVISAYKPNGGLEERFKLEAGTEEGVWDFIRTHLTKLPVIVSKHGKLEIIAERQNYLLFDRMVAFHVQRGVMVPMSATEFYLGLKQRFPERDGMYFLPEQVVKYDKARMKAKEVEQLQFFITNEESAIQWLRQQLTKKPQTFQEIHPQFMKEISGWSKYEKPLELLELLEENFLRYEGTDEVPSQIHAYLSSNYKDLRNLSKDDPNLKNKAKDRWYVPDPDKAGDLEKLRERSLLKEFKAYQESTQKKLKVFRLEAVRAGFKKAWQAKDYKTIIEISKKIPENVLQEDPKLLMWYDQALTRMEQ